MRILLLSMPDSFEHTPSVTVRMPNGALASLAGNIDPHHTVAIADLILAQQAMTGTIERLIDTHRPDVIGLSVMTFQRKTALAIIGLARALCPRAAIVVGGYDPSLAPDPYEAPTSGVDFIVRGEGEATFRELLRALEARRGFDRITGLTYRDDGGVVRNPPRPVSSLGDEIRPPNRAARVLSGYTLLGRPVDIVETSRGCTYDCRFCSIIEMRGRNFHTWGIPRVVADIADARRRGARAIFLVDDNITLNIARFRALCVAIAEAGLQDLDYVVQATTSAIVAGGEDLARLMRRAGFRYIFFGIENITPADLAGLRANAKNTQRDAGRSVGSATRRAAQLMRAHGMLVGGGLIVGNPEETRESIEANLAFAREWLDWPYIQHPMPYPGTPLSEDLRARGLVLTDNVDDYDGMTAVVKNAHLPPEDIELLRWRAERWMKVRHYPAMLAHDPAWILRNSLAMARHTFRGWTLRSWLRLESRRDTYRRFRTLRRADRERARPQPGGPQALHQLQRIDARA